MISKKLEMLTDLMCRPRRRPYSPQDLGSATVKNDIGTYQRFDFDVQFQYNKQYGYEQQPLNCQNEVKNKKVVMKCSIFSPFSKNGMQNNNKKQYEQRICLLAMHGNTGSRMSTISLLRSVMKYDLIFVIFDFVGCGNSEGDHVTLGFYQKHQISAVMEHVYQKYGILKFLLHGRSMGAASAMYYCWQVYPKYSANKQKKIQEYINKSGKQGKQIAMQTIQKLNRGRFGYEVIGIIADSPYFDARQMFADISASRLWFVPNFIINYALNSVNERVKNKTSYMNAFVQDKNGKKQPFSILNDLTISEKQIEIPFPVYIIYGDKDDVIGENHIMQLFRKIQAENKKLHILEGEGHGSHRDDSLKMMAIQWVLGHQYSRMSKRISRDSEILGIGIDEYLKGVQIKDKQEEQKFQELKKIEKNKQNNENNENKVLTLLKKMSRVFPYKVLEQKIISQNTKEDTFIQPPKSPKKHTKL